MNTNQFDQITPPAATTSPDDSASLGRGKIAHLPCNVREELNRRLRNGQAGPEILPWLNALPAVKEILAAQFGDAPINHQNLSNWRSFGYQRWLEEQNRLTEMCDLARYAAKMSEAGHGCVAHGANTIASGKILQFLDTVSSTESSPDGLIKIVAAASLLLKGDHTDARLHLARERVRQRDDQLLLTRDKDQRDVVAIGLRLLGDARAKAIEAAPACYAEKIELLGRHMFSHLWRHRFVPTSPENVNETPEQPFPSPQP